MEAIDPFSPPSPEAIRQTVREVLGRPEFSPVYTWMDFVAAAVRAIGRWLDAVGRWGHDHPFLRWVLIVALVLLLVAILAHLVYIAIGDSLRGDAGPARKRKESAWQALEGTAATWAEALALARESLARGDARRAVWIAHRVLLGSLDEAGLIRFAGWKTNSAYLRECPSKNPGHGTLQIVTDLYERVIYGLRQPAVAEVDATLARVAEHCAEAGHGG